MKNRHIVERLCDALRDSDISALAEVHAADIVVSYPQSGEIFRGADNYHAMLANYPEGLPRGQISAIHGEDDSVVVTSSIPFNMPIITISGGGDTFIVEGKADYGEIGIYNVVVIIEIDGGKVIEETWYFAEPFESPAWRAPFLGR
jgi:SnoaL-like domain